MLYIHTKFSIDAKTLFYVLYRYRYFLFHSEVSETKNPIISITNLQISQQNCVRKKSITPIMLLKDLVTNLEFNYFHTPKTVLAILIILRVQNAFVNLGNAIVYKL